MPQQACPCTPTVLCKADNLNAFWPDTCGNDPAKEPRERINAMRVRPDKPWAPRPGFWYMQHGGAGTVLSAGLMHQASFEAVEQELASMWKHSGGAWVLTCGQHSIQFKKSNCEHWAAPSAVCTLETPQVHAMCMRPIWEDGKNETTQPKSSVCV